MWKGQGPVKKGRQPSRGGPREAVRGPGRAGRARRFCRAVLARIGRLRAGRRRGGGDHEGGDAEGSPLVQGEALRVSFPEVEDHGLAPLEGKPPAAWRESESRP